MTAALPEIAAYTIGFIALSVATLMTLRRRDRHRRDRIRPLLYAAHARLGDENANPDDDVFMTRVAIPGLGECIVEHTIYDSASEVARFMLSVPRASLELPDALGFQATARAHDPYEPTDPYTPPRSVGNWTSATLSWGDVHIHDTLEHLLARNMPEVIHQLKRDDPTGPAPLTRITLDETTLMLSRSLTQDVLDSDFDARFDAFVSKAADLAKAFSWDTEHPELPWEVLFKNETPKSDSRRALFSLLLDAFPGTPSAERAWRHALDHGDLDDMLLAVHHDRARAVAELSTHRLIILANALAEATDAFTTRALPEHIAARFAPDALLDARLSWPVRRALLEHWLAARGPGDPELLECVRQMHGRLDPKPRQELEALLAAHPEVALQGRLSLSHDDEARGALSEPAGEAGGLSQTDD
jgi:hypothetical protein